MNFTIKAEDARTLRDICNSNRTVRSRVESRCMESIIESATNGYTECFVNCHLPDAEKAVLERMGYKLTKAFDSWNISWETK